MVCNSANAFFSPLYKHPFLVMSENCLSLEKGAFAFVNLYEVCFWVFS